jgi:hypothetical protein
MAVEDDLENMATESQFAILKLVCEEKTACVIITVLKYFARIRLVKTEKPSMCVTVNSKVCITAIALQLPVVPSWVHKCNKSNHPVQIPSNSHNIPKSWQFFQHTKNKNDALKKF